MKKTLSLILAIVMAFGVCAAAFAADGTNVVVTISDKGNHAEVVVLGARP